MENTTSCPSQLDVSAAPGSAAQGYAISIGTGGGDNDDTGGHANLAYGLPLFPAIGTARAGISHTDRASSLLDFEVTILFSRTKFHSFYTYFMGVLGPAIAFDLPADVTFFNPGPAVDVGEVDAALHNQNVVAGIGCGLGAGAGFSVLQQFYLPENWFSPWKFAWQTAFDLNVQFNVDVIKLLFLLIQLVIAGLAKCKQIEGDTAKKFDKYLDRGISAVSGYSFFGNSSGFINKTTTTATPKWVIPVDFFSFVPVLKTFNAVLSRVQGGVQLGTQFLVTMPVTLSLDSFDVTGGQEPGKPPAHYGPITVDNSTAKAKGSMGSAFVEGSKPTRLTTNVSYTTGFTIALEFFLHMIVCKFIDKAFTTRSLNLIELLNLVPHTDTIHTFVSTNPQNGCVLIPQMTMSFFSGSDPHYNLPENTVVTDIEFTGVISLSEPWKGKAGTITIETNPLIKGFPTTATMLPDASTAKFKYTFPNDPIRTGDQSDPDGTVSPSATSPYATYSVTAHIDPNEAQPCDDWTVTVPVKVQNRVLFAGFYRGTQAVPPATPPDNAAGAAELNADQSKAPYTKVENFVVAKYEFPYPESSQPADQVEIKIYLLDADRNPHNGSDVVVRFDNGATANLSRPDTVKVPLARFGSAGTTFRLEWRSTGPETGYSSLFFLILDAGGTYGQAEFWLHVWNWS